MRRLYTPVLVILVVIAVTPFTWALANEPVGGWGPFGWEGYMGDHYITKVAYPGRAIIQGDDDESTPFYIELYGEREGYWKNDIWYTTMAPIHGYSMWDVYIKWSYRDMGSVDVGNISIVGWKLVKESENNPIKIKFTIGGEYGGISIQLHDVDGQSSWGQKKLVNGWLYLGSAAAWKASPWVWEWGNNVIVRGYVKLSWNNGYMRVSNRSGEFLKIKVVNTNVWILYILWFNGVGWYWIPVGSASARYQYIIGDDENSPLGDDTHLYVEEGTINGP